MLNKNQKKLIELARNLCNDNPDYNMAICNFVSMLIYNNIDYAYYIADKIGVYKMVSIKYP